MPLTDKEKYQNRIQNNKQFAAYIPNDMAIKFEKKLKDNNITFTHWLKSNIKRYLDNL